MSYIHMIWYSKMIYSTYENFILQNEEKMKLLYFYSTDYCLIA